MSGNWSYEDEAFLVGLGELVRDYRERAGLSQEKLAERAGISRSAVAHIETGRTNFRVTRLRAIITALRIDPRDLF